MKFLRDIQLHLLTSDKNSTKLILVMEPELGDIRRVDVTVPLQATSVQVIRQFQLALLDMHSPKFNPSLTQEEHEYFRPPILRMMASTGDTRRWLYVAQPANDDHVYGVSYKISELARLNHGDNLTNQCHLMALEELRRRIKIGVEFSQPPGSEADVFAWTPSPITYEWKQETHPLNTQDLYARPGRIISVDGSPDGDSKLEPRSGT